MSSFRDEEIFKIVDKIRDHYHTNLNNRYIRKALLLMKVPRCPWVHWVLWNIPADATGLPENVPPDPHLSNGACQGITDFGNTGYGGPAPPSGTHRYYFKLYALDTKLDLPESTTKADLEPRSALVVPAGVDAHRTDRQRDTSAAEICAPSGVAELGAARTRILLVASQGRQHGSRWRGSRRSQGPASGPPGLCRDLRGS